MQMKTPETQKPLPGPSRDSLGKSTVAVAKPVVKVWPNGEFSIGYDSSKRLRRVGGQCDRTENMFWDGASQEFRQWMVGEAAKQLSPLGLSNTPNSHKARRGSKGITSYGGRMVRNACYDIESRYPRAWLSFATLTLPALSQDELLHCAENWARIVRVYFQRLKRSYEAKTGHPFEYVAVTEIQEKRYEHREELGLHLHYLYVGRLRHKSAWIFTPHELRSHWRKTLEGIGISGANYDATENLQRVIKSAEAYLGKYLSKGAKATRRINENGLSAFLPTAWYSISRKLSQRVRSGVRRITRGASAFVHSCFGGNNFSPVRFIRGIEVDMGLLGFRVIGFYGKLKKGLTGTVLKSILETVDSTGDYSWLEKTIMGMVGTTAQ